MTTTELTTEDREHIERYTSFKTDASPITKAMRKALAIIDTQAAALAAEEKNCIALHKANQKQIAIIQEQRAALAERDAEIERLRMEWPFRSKVRDLLRKRTGWLSNPGVGDDEVFGRLVEAMAAEPAERADQWRDIESAPKDGTKVLLYWPHWSGVAVIGYNADHRWISMVKLSDEQDPGPTHWQPLPSPPAQETHRGN